MNARPPTLDPRLAEVLHDLARDPDARLFRTSPKQLIEGLRTGLPRPSACQAGLTSAARNTCLPRLSPAQAK